MRFQPYDNYRQCEVAWVGQIPKHWSTKPLWTLYRRVKRIGHENEELLSVYRDFGVIPKASRDDNFNNASEDLSTYQLVFPGDLVVNKMKAWQGSVAISEFRGIVSPAYFVMGARHAERSRYLHYLFRSEKYIGAYLALSKGIRVNQWDLDPSYHSRMPVLIPPHDEQVAIANFLDDELGRIDELINEQERLIELLKEKRQAVLSHAVTKGLNPDVPMKPSGIGWLGNVPAHWTIARIKHAAMIGNGSTPNRDRVEYWAEGAYPWLSSTVVNRDVVREADEFVTELALAECHLPRVSPPAVLVGITGEGRTRGMAAMLAIEATLNQHLAFIKPISGLLDAWYLRRYLDMAYVQLRLESEGGGSTKAAITCAQLANLPIPRPPIDEQEAISARVGKALNELDALLLECERSIVLLGERRAALIAVAVTGEIDVRDEHAIRATEPATAE